MCMIVLGKKSYLFTYLKFCKTCQKNNTKLSTNHSMHLSTWLFNIRNLWIFTQRNTRRKVEFYFIHKWIGILGNWIKSMIHFLMISVMHVVKSGKRKVYKIGVYVCRYKCICYTFAFLLLQKILLVLVSLGTCLVWTWNELEMGSYKFRFRWVTLTCHTGLLVNVYVCDWKLTV